MTGKATSRRNSNAPGLIWPALLGLFSTFVMLQTSPWVVQTPRNDSGIFLYFGAQILKGKLPFVHLWDHKPPLIFYLDALGLLLGGGSQWGVWAIEVVSLFSASLFAFLFLRRYFSAWPAFLGVLGMLFNLAFVLEGGNLTEEYALVFQFAALYLFSVTESRQKPGWRGYAIGAAMGAAFLLKQTLIGVWLAIILYILSAAFFTRAKRGITLLVQIAAGFTAVLLVSVGYFALSGALAAYWDVAFGYNFVYSNVGTTERVASLTEILWFLNTRAGFFLLALAAWLAGIGFILLHHEPTLWHTTRRWPGALVLAAALLFLVNGLFVEPFRMYALSALSPYRWSLIGVGVMLLLVSFAFFGGLAQRKGYPWLKRYQAACDSPALLPVFLALVDLPINLFLVSVSGRGYLHYYLSLFPSLTILAAFLAWFVLAPGSKRTEQPMRAVWSVALLLPTLFGGLAQTLEKIQPGVDSQTEAAVSYIQTNTQAEDTVLLWGSQSGINYLADRSAPTRFVHLVPLFNAEYASQGRLQEFLNDLQTAKPALIIDTRLDSMPLVYDGQDPQRCAGGDPLAPPGMSPVYAFICENYIPVETLGKDSWIVYRYNPAGQTSTGTR